MCDCIQKLTEKLAKHYDAPVEFDLVKSIDPVTMELGLDLPPLLYTYRPAKQKTGKRGSVTFAFCPFCGVKYKP